MAVDARCHLRSQLSCLPDFCIWPLDVATLVMNISPIDYLGFFNKVVTAFQGLPWWLSGEESACNVGDLGSIPELGRSPGRGYGNPLQYFCLEKSMDREAWWATIYRVAQSGVK